MDVFDWQEERKINSARERIYKAHESNAWALIFDQCSTGLKTQLEGAPKYAAARADDDIITLISLIQGYCCRFDQQSQAYMAIAETFKNLCLFFQRTNQSNNEYFKDFTSLVDTLETYGGNGALGYLPALITVELQLLCDALNPPIAIAKIGSQRVGSAGRSAALNIMPLLVPPRMNTAGIVRDLIPRVCPLHSQNA